MTPIPVDRACSLVAGVDIGGTYIKVGLVDRGGRVLHRIEHPSQAELGFDHFVERIAQAVEMALGAGGATAGQLAGIGVGYPGTVYPDTGLISGSPNIPGSEGRNLVEPLQARFQRAVVPINDASGATLGEARYGLGAQRRIRDLVMFTMGTGIGGGVVIDGRVLYGAHHQGSELGHMVVDPDGPLCGCGQLGCLEAFCGTAGILRRAWHKLQTGRPSLLREMIREFQNPELTPRQISEAAEQGDAVALEVWAEIGFWMGIGAVTVVNAFDPEYIVIGGQIAKAGAPLFDAIRNTVRSRARLNPWPWQNIVPAVLGDDSGLLGAAAVVLQELD